MPSELDSITAFPLQWPGGWIRKKNRLDAHRALALQHHPDRGGTDYEMARINEARSRGVEAGSQ